MAKSCFKNVKITGISAVVPKKEINIEDEIQYYDNNRKKIDRIIKMVGLHKRRVVDNSITAVDLCTQAAENLLKKMQISSDEIDALVFVVQNPDYICPASACIIHKNLKLKTTCPAFDINQGCAGYIYGLWVASSLIEGGNCKKVLLCAGDTFSIHCNKKNRITAPVFGDGGSATLLEFSQNTTPSYYDIGADGNGFENIIIPAGGAKIPFTKENCNDLLTLYENKGNYSSLYDLYMDGMEIFNFTMNVVPENIKNLLNYANISIENIDKLFLHQANKQIVQTIADNINISMEKVPHGPIEKYGNQTIASIPMAICDDYSIDEYSKPKTTVMSGYGIGLAWGTCAITLDNIQCCKVEDFSKEKDVETSENLINKWTNKLKGIK